MNQNATEPKSVKERVLRAHDITVCLQRTTVPEFENLQVLGMATRLAIHLRGVTAVKYDLVKSVAHYLLDFSIHAVRPVLELLEEAEFVRLVSEGNTIKTVIPDIPYYEQLFSDLGEASDIGSFSEHESFSLDLLQRLSKAPLSKDFVYQIGAEKRLVDRVLDIGSEGAFLNNKRARGRDILLSPTYFSENADAYADLVAGHGAKRVKRVLELLKKNQGWPLALIIKNAEISGNKLSKKDIAVARLMASDGFIPPPAIETAHAGQNHFLFGPRPDDSRLPPFKRPVFEAAMALVAAMRQGQLLPNQYRIRSPYAVLRKLRDSGYIGANSEAVEQYRNVAALRVGRLVKVSGTKFQFQLIRSPENNEAVKLAMDMLRGDEMALTGDDEIMLALRKGEAYVDSLIGRKNLVKEGVVSIDEESQNAIDDFLLKGAK